MLKDSNCVKHWFSMAPKSEDFTLHTYYINKIFSPYLQFYVSHLRKSHEPLIALMKSYTSYLKKKGKFPVYWPTVYHFICVCNSCAGSQQ